MTAVNGGSPIRAAALANTYGTAAADGSIRRRTGPLDERLFADRGVAGEPDERLGGGIAVAVLVPGDTHGPRADPVE